MITRRFANSLLPFTVRVRCRIWTRAVDLCCAEGHLTDHFSTKLRITNNHRVGHAAGGSDSRGKTRPFPRRGPSATCPPRKTAGFSLVELLVVIGVISTLVGILLPALSSARAAAQRAVCASNLRQLATAAHLYAADNQGFLPPAHLHFITQNLARWHGTRPDLNTPFDFATSPMRRQLQTPAIKACPSFVFVETTRGFERSAGGYGYNATYLGSSSGIPELASLSLPIDEYERRVTNVPARLAQIRKPAETVVFADTAIANPLLIEYSFIEPPFDSSGNLRNSPSLHFRHRRQANLAWLDGHVSTEPLTFTAPKNVYKANNAQFLLGYTGPNDNSWFDRK